MIIHVYKMNFINLNIALEKKSKFQIKLSFFCLFVFFVVGFFFNKISIYLIFLIFFSNFMKNGVFSS